MTAAGIGRIGFGRMAQTAIFRFSIPAFQYREFQYTGSAIKPQESQSPDFSKEVRRDGG
jgi:hypothetical protein